MLLTLRALFSWKILECSNLWIPAFALSLVLFALTLWLYIEAKQKRSIAIILFVICIIYGAGLAMNLNGALANSPPIRFQALLLEKHSFTGRYAHDDFVLSPWGQQKQINTESVQADVYHRHSIGDTVSISVTNGALGIPFYSIE